MGSEDGADLSAQPQRLLGLLPLGDVEQFSMIDVPSVFHGSDTIFGILFHAVETDDL